MKKFFFLIPISLCLLFSSGAKAQNNLPPLPGDTANFPYWIEMMQDPSINFFKVQKAFNTYWKDRKITKGCGWKPFKRWEYIVQYRIHSDGTRPPADATYTAYMNLHKSIQTTYGNWISLGPATIPSPGPAGYEGLGRLNVVAFHPTDPNKIYVGSPSGGMWQSTDGGATWVSHTDSLATLGVSCIVIDHNNPNLIFIGTGDRDAGDAPGMGIFKSTDGGLTWSLSNTGMGTKTVGKLIQHPSNGQILIAATNAGVYRSVNGGANWTLSVSGDFKDVVFKPNDPNTVYAASGPEFYRSTNNGTTFTYITSGLSGGQRGAIAVTAANPNYVYFLVSGGDSGFKGFYRSTDSGMNFTTRSTSPNILDWSCDGSGTGGQGWYDLALAANPNNAEDVYVGGVDVWRSTDGGTSWVINSHWYGGCSVPAVHADCHILTYNPVDGQLYAGNDGGVWSTGNSGVNWTDHTVGLTIGQIYKLGQSQTIREKIINGFQDNGTYTHVPTGWLATGGGDGMECAIDYSNPAYTYHTVYYGDIYRKINNNNEVHIAGNGVNGITESGAWVTPFLIHNTDPNTMFIGYDNIWRCNTIKAANMNWVKISDNLAGTNNSQMAALEQSAANPDIFYAGRYDGHLFRSDNCNAANPTWTDITNYLPESGVVSDMATHPSEPNTIYLAINNSVYKSTNKGMSWTNLSSNLTGMHLNTIVYYKNALEGLYVGSDAGVYYRDQTMTDWISFSNGLPVNGHVTELEIYYDNDSVSRDAISASTYGRGLWQSNLYHATPHTDFIADKTLIPTACSVNFTDLSSGIPTNWQWTFTGGTPSSSNVKNPANILYNTPGTFPVKLKAWNEFGMDSIIKNGYITVNGTLVPNVNFYTDNAIPCIGELVHLFDSTQNCPNSWYWTFSPNTMTFANGTSAYDQNPVVQFNVPGSYDVTLQAWNNVGSVTLTKQDYILYGGYNLPFSEGFENGFTTKHWSVLNPDYDMTWDTLTIVGTSPGHIAAWINYYNYAQVNKRDQLISPPVNLQNYSSAVLSFSHAYAQRASIKDSLIVKISGDCGSTWTRILAAGPNSSQPNLFATHANMLNAFYPQSDVDWCGSSFGTSCYSLDLSQWAGQSNIKIMFESFNRHGNNLFIDNVEISGPEGIVNNDRNTSGILIYPNPSAGIFNLYIFKGKKDVEVTICNIEGKSVYSGQFSTGSEQLVKDIDLTGSAKGIYFARITTEKTTRVEKIIIN